MQIPCILFFCVLAFLATLEVVSGTCEGDHALSKCMGNYVSGFTSTSNDDLDDVSLHCKLDRELAVCIDHSLGYCYRSSSILISLGRAVLSYVVFDRKLRVCPYKTYWGLYQKLRTGGSLSNTSSWDHKINTLLHMSQYSYCAKQENIKCLKKFVQKMKKNPDVCTNIPFKSDCLKDATTRCSSGILKDLLNVFPEEANKVLSVLCKQPQDSG
ncbi:hypothetical protein QZH41_018015 [Actinostola sp. cb2023]|nr:hypothetical protein QZH41_018015 [Actinostola sp. cb2023]